MHPDAGRRTSPSLHSWKRRPAERPASARSDRVLAFLGGVAQLVERLTGSQEVRGFESLRLHPKVLVTGVRGCGDSLGAGANVANCSHTAGTGVRKES
jgi:hypothetical protein